MLFLILLLSSRQILAQSDFLGDSLKRNLSLVHTDADKLYALFDLACYYTTLNNTLSEQYAHQALEIAELSRDRKLIVLAYLDNGDRYLNNMSALEGSIMLAMENFHNAEKEARENGLDAELGYAYIGLARTYRAKGDYARALNYNNQALSMAGALNDDSLKVTAYNSTGKTYQVRNEKLLAFRSYLEGLDVAELSKKEPLLKLVYDNLSGFYSSIEEYDKALDYQVKILGIDRKDHHVYDLPGDYNSMGWLFAKKHEMDLALAMYEHEISVADSLRSPNHKLNGYLAITNLYFDNGQNVKGAEYFKSHGELADYFTNAGMGFVITVGYGSIDMALGKFDSSYYFFRKAEPEIEQKASRGVKYNFYTNFAECGKERGDNKLAIAYLLKARQLVEEANDMRYLEECDKDLDTLYGREGDYRTAYKYNSEYIIYKDSIESLAKQTDVLKLEVENDNRRRERLAREEEENTQHRHNVQYMGLTAGLAALFILLGMLGFFVVHPRTIRALGFFSFIFLFEFIILIADKQIHEWTHGEPWKILIIKIFLAAILLPLHHSLEHTVIHYLTSRKKKYAVPNSFWGKLGKKKRRDESGEIVNN